MFTCMSCKVVFSSELGYSLNRNCKLCISSCKYEYVRAYQMSFIVSFESLNNRNSFSCKLKADTCPHVRTCIVNVHMMPLLSLMKKKRQLQCLNHSCQLCFVLLPPANEVWAKVKFLHVCHSVRGRGESTLPPQMQTLLDADHPPPMETPSP